MSAAARRRRRASAQDEQNGDGPSASGRPWSPLPLLPAMALLAGFAVILWLLATDDAVASSGHSRILSFLHGINLVFHEAGHILFSPFGRTLTILGGSLMQLIIPAVVAFSFWKRRDTAGFAVGGFWFFENFVDVGVYIADARALVLPLLHNGGPESHDWHNLLMGWGLLRADTAIAGTVTALGWLGMLASVGFVFWRFLRERGSR